ncbi:hypothetical protein R3I93_010990 [Phoxinus phoxinus]|uniref:Tumor necrosis factor receptor superfamily member 6 n=1 Tax=Phoxinus phoxinus TaxID=58324 RepID=A0AAN9CZ79_9TELE
MFSTLTVLMLKMFAVELTEGRRMRKRRDTCGEGRPPYQHEGKTCCQCPTGYRVLRHCTDTNQTACDRCESNTYSDHPNSDHNCRPCKICNTDANMELETKCSEYSNTVCKCQKDHYCDQGVQCKICKPCDTCDEVDIACNVCKDAKDTTMSNGAIAAAVLVPVIAIICLVLFFLWKHKKSTVPKEYVEVELLKELDLNPYLSEIADHLSWKVMKRVALNSGMTKAYIDNNESNHPNDAREQTYGLLEDWSQKQGLYKAYPALINTLRKIKERRTADEIKEIVEKRQAEAQP